MTPEVKQGVNRFLRRAIFDEAPARQIRRIELYHHPPHANASMVWRKEWTDEEWEDQIRVAPRTSKDRRSKKLADKLVEMLESLTSFVCQVVSDDAEQMRGRQRYRLIAIDSEGERVGRHFLTVDGAETDGEGDEDDEMDPSLKGLLRQQMQINAALVKSSQMGFAQIIQTQTRMLKDSQDHVEALLDQRREMFETVEEAMSLNHERQLEAERARADQEIKSEAVKSLKLLGPAVLNRVSGKDAMPATEPRGMLIDELIKSFKPEQLSALASAGILKQDQLIALMELIRPNDDNSEGDANGT